ncbi:hypothetical protein FXO38_27434 [Capsicum annuum]|nr:hypothetical protein FXO37_30320 [Capsicum annuum]KAF3629929.1 hypothetical protein FXO38_27434 [Capsicum annuum]
MEQEFIHKWQLSCERDMAPVVVMPGVTFEMLDNFVTEFSKKRLIWYQDGNKVQPPCPANDIEKMTNDSLMQNAATTMEANSIASTSRANAPQPMAPAEKPRKFASIDFKQ